MKSLIRIINVINQMDKITSWLKSSGNAALHLDTIRKTGNNYDRDIQEV